MGIVESVPGGSDVPGGRASRLGDLAGCRRSAELDEPAIRGVAHFDVSRVHAVMVAIRGWTQLRLAYSCLMARSLDTSADANQRQLLAFRSMTPTDRLQLADTMSAEVRSLAEAGIRQRHPEYSAEERQAALADILLGRELAAASRRPRRPPNHR